MSYQDRLEEEINRKLDALTRLGAQWKAPWIAHEICLEHEGGLISDGSNDDRAFWHHGGYLHTRRTVTQVINKRAGEKPKPESPQLILNGFERNRLHDYYVVIRDGEELGVPIIGNGQITDKEIDEKSDFYKAMGDGCYEHADELARFKEWRRRAA